MNAKESISIPFEPPKPKSKYNIDIKSVEEGRWCRNRKITLASGGRIINNFKDIAVEKFGKAYEIKGNFTKSGPYGPMPMDGPWATSLYFL